MLASFLTGEQGLSSNLCLNFDIYLLAKDFIGSNMFLLNYCKILNSFFVLLLLLFFQSISFAQETVPSPEYKSNNTVNNVRALTNRLDSLERNIQDISRILYKNKTNLKTDSENISSKNTSSSSPFIQRMTANEVRMSELETELRRLTGLVERSANDVTLMQQRIDKLVQDLDIRLKSIEKVVTNLETDTNQNRDFIQNTESQPNGNNVQDNESRGRSLNESTSVTKDSVLPNADPKEQYAYARSLLMKLDYQSAELAFKEFIKLNQEHKLSSNAYYWLGEVYYVKKSYAEAAGAFIDSYKLFPLGNKAPDSLLKLGMSLAELGNSNEACESFEELLVKFPKANSRVRRRALQESVRVGCKN